MIDNKKGVLEKDKQPNNVKLKSEMYNHDNELIERREESGDAIMWGFILGFILFFILLVLIVAFTI